MTQRSRSPITMVTSLVDQRNATLEERIERFSDWYRVRRAVALCSKYIQKLKKRVNKEPSEVIQVSAEDLEKAGKSIIYAAQTKAFQDEFKLLAREAEEERSFPKQKTAKLRSSINKLDPFIDENGILRVGGTSQACRSLRRGEASSYLTKRQPRDQSYNQVLSQEHQAPGQRNDAQ